jgi:hypothetical protein
MKQGVRSFRVLAFMFALFGLMALSAGVAYGQAIDGNIIGTIVDSQGAAVVGADVTATNVETNVVSTTKTSGSGEYRFDHLLVGTYRISAKMTGFKTVSEMVAVELNKTGTRNITLSPGAATETVEVSGVPPVIDTTTAQLQTNYDSRTVSDSAMAAVGSGVINLSLLDAGVASSGGVGLGSGPSISGQRPRNNNYTVEGVDNNSKAVTGPLLQLPNDAVEQFTVLQNQFSPEFGHSSGGQFNQTIKSGTNSFHGRVYEYFQNRKLNAQDSQVALSQVSQGLTPFNPRFDNNRFGGQFGGPLIKNKLFFFTNWEYNPIGGTTASTACGPTAAEFATLAGISGVSQVNVQQFQQAVGAAHAAAPANDANCLPSTTVLGTDVEIGDIGFAGAQYSNFLTGVISGDYNISDRDQLRARYAHEKVTQIDVAGQIPSFWTTLPTKYDLFTLSEFHSFRPNLSNEVRLGFNYNGSTTPSGNFSFPGLDAFPNLIIGFFEGNGVQIGPDGNAPQFGYQDFYQIVDNVSWVKGRHNFKVGAEYRQYISPQGFTQRVRGDYDYTSFEQYFADLVPDFLAERSIGNTTYYGNQNEWYWFVNDDWHVKKNFSVNVGLRYEFTQPPLSERQWQPLNAISSVPGLIDFHAPTAQKKNFLPRIGFAWSPGSSGTTSIRGGYSMAVDVLYDNLGLLSAPPQLQQTCDATPGDESAATATCFWSDPTLGQPGFLASGGLPFSATVPPIPDVAAARGATAGFIPDQKLPYSETWTLGIQHIFAQKYTAEVRYVGTRGIHLPVQSRLNRQNQITATEFLPTYFAAPDQSTLDASTNTYGAISGNSSFVPAYANITLPDGVTPAGFTGANVVGFMPFGSSHYNGLQTQLTRSFNNGLQFQVAYTWSHAMDDSTADVFSTYLTPRRPQDFQCFHCDYSDSALDRRHRLTIEALYDVPFLKHSDSWVKRNVLGNWQAGPVYTFQSPEYATVQSGRDVNGNGDSAGDRTIINSAGVRGTGADSSPLCTSSLPSTATCGHIDLPKPGQPDPTDDSAFYLVGYLANPNPNGQAAYYVAGGKFAQTNSRRNTLPMPRISDVDFSALKRINMGERQSIEFQFQALNLFNHAQNLPGYISDVAPLGFTGSNVLGMLEPYSPSFNDPKAIFTNHPRAVVLVLKYNF